MHLITVILISKGWINQPIIKRENLLNFKKKPYLPLKILPKGKFSGYLRSNIIIFWLPVSYVKKTIFSEKQIFYVHLKPNPNEITVEGEET